MHKIKQIHHTIENIFEKFASLMANFFGSWITFVFALIFVLFWFAYTGVVSENFHDFMYDIMISITFLGFFILQKRINKNDMAIHVKLNELISAHHPANNDVMGIEDKPVEEIHRIKEQHDQINKV